MRRTDCVVVVLLAAILLGVPTSAVATVAAADPLDPELRAWLDTEGPLRIGYPAFPPMSAVGGDGVPEGYAVDIWDLGALKLGIEVEHVVVGTVPEAVAALRDGAIDALGGAGVRPDLEDGVVRTRAIAHPPTGFVVRADRVGVLPADLDGATVTTVPGSPLEARLSTVVPGATYVPAASTAAAFDAVADGDVDAMYGPYAALGALIIASDADVVPFGDPDVPGEGIAGVARAGTEAAAVLQTMRAALGDQELSLIHVKWTGIDLSDPATRVGAGLPGWVLPSIAGGLGLAALLAVFVWLLRRRITSATDELVALNDELEHRVDARTAELADTTARLRRSNQALRRFSTTAAHDIKGPITAIGGLSSVLEHVELGPDERSTVVHRIQDGATRLAAMVDTMLEDALALGAGAASITGPVFERWLREVTAPELDVAGGRLEVDVPTGIVDADAEALRRAAINLVGNAVKYAGNDGQDVLVQVRLRRDDAVWELQVDDNGAGIPQSRWSTVFDRGERLGREDGQGFGLGLAAVREVVRGVGGSITVGHAPLGGARFTVNLPVVPQAEPVVEPDALDRTEA